MKPTDFNHTYLPLSTGITMHVVDEGDPRNPCVLLVHGFADLWFGFRHLIKPLVQSGYRVLCPDMLGYGATRPLVTDPERFRISKLTADLAALLDASNVNRAFVVGHDWGSVFAWRMCLFFPQRVIGVCGFCTPYIPPSKHYMSVDDVAKMFPMMGYQRYFNEANAHQEIEENIEFFFRLMVRGTKDDKDPIVRQFLEAKQPSIIAHLASRSTLHLKESKLLSRDELQYYIEQSRGTFCSTLNYYRRHKLDFEDELHLPSTIHHPALMVTVGRHPLFAATVIHKMEKLMPQLSKAHIQEAGHWVLQEHPQAACDVLLPWLNQQRSKL
eukprot:c5837_g1_i1.p1 GENE.c5837_g1_i1~~c5837_g1_i1.p1  ORF type:complete len:343 (-),score=83.07 c5837_g1_i1:100-1080(-)